MIKYQTFFEARRGARTGYGKSSDLHSGLELVKALLDLNFIFTSKAEG